MDPYYAYRHLKEHKKQLERQSRVYHEYLHSLLIGADLTRNSYNSNLRDLYVTPHRRDFAETARPKPAVPADGFWIAAQKDAKGRFKDASEKIDRKKKTEENPKKEPFRGLRPFY